MKNICIIYNSKISLFNKFLLNRIIKILKKENHVETFATERVGHATLLCKVHIKKFDIIVAAGGDGTINEVINGMDDKTSLGIIPLGTANELDLSSLDLYASLPAATDKCLIQLVQLL